MAADRDAIYQIHATAFPTNLEAQLVALIRERGKVTASLVAERDEKVVGHLLFSPVTVHDHVGAGLAPIAVPPEFQGQGIGSMLIEHALEQLRQIRCPFAVVLGDPTFYSRFGFKRASQFGLQNEYRADDAFMAQELQPGGLPIGGGLVKYASEFNELGV